jgi:small subunit ribosomal protein S6
MSNKCCNNNKYEIIYILKNTLNDKSAKEEMLNIKSLINKLGGQSIKINCWGRKKLAWEYKHHKRGIYVHHQYLGNKDLVSNLVKQLNINEEVLLHQTKIINKEIQEITNNNENDILEIPIIKDYNEHIQHNYNFEHTLNSKNNK